MSVKPAAIPRPSDPFAAIPDSSREYADTILETAQEREQRDRVFPVADEDVTFPSDSRPSGLDDWGW